MRTRLVIPGMLLVCCAVLPSQQQKPESIMIGPGDIVHVQVLDTPEFDQHAHVSDAGTIHLIAGPEVNIGGKSPADAAAAIESSLVEGQLMLHPHVVVTEEELATAKVSIIGDVKVPGAYSIQTPRPILQVLSMAGGLDLTADRRIVIERHDSKQQIPYFFSNVGDQAFNASVDVNPGDTVYVPKAGIAYALGDVHIPGGYTMTDNQGKLTVLELVARAGGVSHTAAAPHTRLIRKTEQGYVEINLPLKDMLNGKRPDMALLPNDIIYVPFSYLRNATMNPTQLIGSAGTAAVYRF